MLAGWREEEARKQGAREASRPGGGRVRDFARKAGELAPQCSKKKFDTEGENICDIQFQPGGPYNFGKQQSIRVTVKPVRRKSNPPFLNCVEHPSH
jgi:hypothetical protein